MNLVLYGRKNLINNLGRALADEDVEFVEAGNLERVYSLAKSGECVFLVDIMADGAQSTCAQVNEAGKCPVVLVLGGNPHDWAKTQLMEAHGFVSTRASNDEIGSLAVGLEALSVEPHDVQIGTMIKGE